MQILGDTTLRHAPLAWLGQKNAIAPPVAERGFVATAACALRDVAAERTDSMRSRPDAAFLDRTPKLGHDVDQVHRDSR